MYPYTAPVHSLRHLITFAYVQTNYTSSDLHMANKDNAILTFPLTISHRWGPFPWGVYERYPRAVEEWVQDVTPKICQCNAVSSCHCKTGGQGSSNSNASDAQLFCPPLPLHCISVEGWSRDYYFSYKHRAGRDRYICFGIPKLS